MKRTFFLFLSILFSCIVAAEEHCPVIPKPVSAKKLAGIFRLSEHTSIAVSGDQLKGSAYFLQQELLRTRQLALRSGPVASSAILLELKEQKGRSAESYQLLVEERRITITATHPSGILYGIMSLLQLLEKKSGNNEIAIPCWSIEDAPAYGWRGLMLDESRHFFGKEKLRSILDWMAFYKLNRFHWHLTDEPAWRIEIKRYPLLALVGGTGTYTDPLAPARYYTQQDIREIVAYASERNITVIPEIDMPGHATAANRAYPAFSGGGSEKHPEFTFNPGREETYQYLAGILRETDALFPSDMIHLGGDEVSYGNEKWNGDTGIRKLMEDRQLKDLKAVETYFMQRMADSLLQLNNRVLVWDEMADATLPQDRTILFWWRHDQPAQLKKALERGYATVLCPRLPFYFDFVQDSSHRSGRKWSGQFNALKNVYDFNAGALAPAGTDRELVLGIQANLWTETVDRTERLDYLLFPRISALSEAAWSREKDYSSYLGRLKAHLPLYDQARLYYFNPFQPGAHPEPAQLK